MIRAELKKMQDDNESVLSAMYLRKSRAEENMSLEETIHRHKTALTAYAEKYGFHVPNDAIYEEVISGESLYARPQMLRLLEDVERGRYQAVLVMDMQRLGRGGMYDQGMILDTFKYSGTLIVTPERVYDLSSDQDEQAAEMETFMSRGEYRMITKRLRRGLKQSIQEGAYTANAPYGYTQVKKGKLPSLEIVPEEAENVRRMFEMYASGIGCTRIEREMNSIGARGRRGGKFNRNTIRMILTNPVYIGKIRWNHTSHVKTGIGANRKTKIVYNRSEQWNIYDGKHDPIVWPELFEIVQNRMHARYHPVAHEEANPFAGLIRCSGCGKNMILQGKNKGVPYLLCPTPGCTAGAKYEYVEAAILKWLRLLQIKLEKDICSGRKADISGLATAREKASVQLARLSDKKRKIYEYLEDGTYDKPTFVERMEKLHSEECDAQEILSSLNREIELVQAKNKAAQLRQLETVLELYDQASVSERKALMYSIIENMTYSKMKKTKPGDFSITIELRDFI